jgi:hypothetical protein
MGPTDGPTAPPERARVGYPLTRELEPALAAKGSTFLVAEWRGRVIGFAQYMRRSSPTSSCSAVA